MERLQGPINPCFLESHVNVECLEEQENEYGHCSITDNYYGFEDHHVYNNKNLDSTMPFLQMLQELPPYEEPNLHLLLRLQNHHQKNQYPWIISPDWTVELESCVTEAQSPIKSEKSKDPPPPPSSSAFDRTAVQMTHSATKEKRKRKRMKLSKNREEVESQRMTHIAVERNRRKQMNDHLSSLRSLMPPSFVQRGDQASIIGGAIDFVKELEQLLQSLQAEKRMRSDGQDGLTSSDSAAGPFDGFFTSPQYTRYSSSCSTTSSSLVGDEGWTADIEVTMIQSHANVKVLTPRRQGQLVRAIAALEDLHLVVLHLNITSLQSSVLYSINLKIEDECKLGTADDIATAVHKIFSFINDS